MKVATAIISCEALRHNLQQIRKLVPQCRIISVVKANAYGHGLLETAKILTDTDCFGVARISEALALRSEKIVQPILLLEGFFSEKDLPVLITNNIDTVVHSEYQLIALEQAELSRPITVWMKIDTGMHRLGVRVDEVTSFYQRLLACKNVAKPINFLTHLSCADELMKSTTMKQLACFDRCANGKNGEQSVAASAGILMWPETHRDWVRPGLISYGISPFSDKFAADYSLKPAMTLKSRLIAVRDHKKGEPVGYGEDWVSDKDTRLGVVAMGYGDGYPRDAPSGTPVWLNGREVPIVGRISMDMISVDLGHNSCDGVGDEVIFWGENLPIERIALFTGFSPYEIITGLTSRVGREYLLD